MHHFGIVGTKISKRMLIGASVLVSLVVAATVWFVVLIPIDRCFTSACREAVQEANLDAVENEWAPVIAKTQADLDHATRDVKQSQQNIREADRALLILECQKGGRVC